jgi:Cof subfamily protein (haloacid dehalogenase superfamily)
LCAIDLDDTLLGPDHKLSQRNATAIKKVVEAGVVVLIASGRMYAASLPTAKELQLDAPIICYNGAMVKHPFTGETWMEESVAPAVAGDLMDYCRQAGLQLNFYWQDLLYTAAYTPWLELYHNRTGAPLEVRSDFYSFLKGIAPTKLIIVDDPERIDQLLPEMRDRYGASIYVTKSNKEYLEFLPPGANKGSALAFVADRYGVTAAETIAFGDSWNDLPMLNWAGLSVAVGNAKPEVIAAADRTVLSNAEDGVGIALEEIFNSG